MTDLGQFKIAHLMSGFVTKINVNKAIFAIYQQVNKLEHRLKQ
jgi:hypothetical protein